MPQSFFELPSLEAIARLLTAAVVVMGSPGPANISASAVGTAFGFRRSIPYVLGLFVGTQAVLIAVAAGVTGILASSPGLAPVVTVLGMAYMLVLAYRIALAPPVTEVTSETQGPRFLGGLLLSVANPKAYFAIGAVFAGQALGLQPPLLETLAKTLLLALTVTVILTAWLTLGSLLTRVLRQPKVSRAVNVAFAILLLVAVYGTLREVLPV